MDRFDEIAWKLCPQPLIHAIAHAICDQCRQVSAALRVAAAEQKEALDTARSRVAALEAQVRTAKAEAWEEAEKMAHEYEKIAKPLAAEALRCIELNFARKKDALRAQAAGEGAKENP